MYDHAGGAWQEFLDDCVNVDDQHPGATRIDGGPARRREAARLRKQSEYHALAAQDNLEGQAPLMAIREGYYVMMHKANEALALAGFKPRSHRCTLLGLRGVFNAPDLADMLRPASQERRNVDDGIDPEDPELAAVASPRSFIKESVVVFVDRVDELIDEEGLGDGAATGPTELTGSTVSTLIGCRVLPGRHWHPPQDQIRAAFSSKLCT